MHLVSASLRRGQSELAALNVILSEQAPHASSEIDRIGRFIGLSAHGKAAHAAKLVAFAVVMSADLASDQRFGS